MVFPLANLTLATFLTAEFGFLGFMVYIFEHTPFRCGHPSKAGVLISLMGDFRHPLIVWLIVDEFIPVLENDRSWVMGDWDDGVLLHGVLHELIKERG